MCEYTLMVFVFLVPLVAFGFKDCYFEVTVSNSKTVTPWGWTLSHCAEQTGMENGCAPIVSIQSRGGQASLVWKEGSKK